MKSSLVKLYAVPLIALAVGIMGCSKSNAPDQSGEIAITPDQEKFIATLSPRDKDLFKNKCLPPYYNESADHYNPVQKSMDEMHGQQGCADLWVQYHKMSESAANASLQKGDPNKPDSEYAEWTSSVLVFKFNSKVASPLDYESIAKSYSEKYDRLQDTFKRNDMLTQLKPEIDAKIKEASQHDYYIIKNALSYVNFSHYDPSTKSFTLENMPDNLESFSYQNGIDVSYSFTNGEEFRTFVVQDEAKARMLESKYAGTSWSLTADVYAYVQSVELGTSKVKLQILKVVLKNKNGEVIETIAK